MFFIPALKTLNPRLRALTLSLLILSPFTSQAEELKNPTDLFEQLLSIQAQMNIKIIGLERIQNEEKIKTRGSLSQQTEQLLASFNHIVSRNNKGEIERIVIINKKQKS